MKYTIVPGDTLTGLATKYLGDGRKWRVLWDMNRAVLKSGDPNLIYHGEIIDIPETKIEPTPKKSEDKNEVFLYVNGKEFSGWTDVSIKRSIEAMSGSFSVSVVERWQGQSEPWPIYAGDKVQVRIGNDEVVTGYVDDTDISIGADDHSISVAGRDKTADLVDCSVVAKPWEWNKKTLDAIASELCQPFGVTVKKDADVGAAIERFQVQPGETVFEVLDRAAKQRGILVTSTRSGELLFTKTGTRRLGVTVKEGLNVVSASAKYSTRDRFSRYTVEGQDESASLSYTATDDSVRRNRPLVIVAESAATNEYLKKRASWEAIVRAARATSVSVEVAGWRDGSGNLWEENALVNVDLPSLKISGEMIISEVEYRRGADAGTSTALTLKRKDAYTPEVTIPKGNEP